MRCFWDSVVETEKGARLKLNKDRLSNSASSSLEQIYSTSDDDRMLYCRYWAMSIRNQEENHENAKT